MDERITQLSPQQDNDQGYKTLTKKVTSDENQFLSQQDNNGDQGYKKIPIDMIEGELGNKITEKVLTFSRNRTDGIIT